MKNSLPLILPQLNLLDVEPEQFMNCDPLDVVDRGKSPVRSNIKRHKPVELDGSSTDLCLNLACVPDRELTAIFCDIFSHSNQDG